jgi:hypothetical protein
MPASRDLLRAQISSTLAKASVRPITVAGVELFVRGLSGAERVHLQKWAAEAEAGGEPVSDHRVAWMGLCDADGVRLFDQVDDVAVLDGASVSEIAKAIIDASGLGKSADEAAAKN